MNRAIMIAELKNGARHWKEATMQPSDMTNEELASYIVNTIGGGIFKEYYAEVAARLRNATVREMAHRAAVEAFRREVKDLNSKRHATICDLRRRLKIAEVALERIDNMCDGDMCKHFDNTHHCSACRYLESCQTGVAHSALNEVREKGGNNGK